ncbi:MAG: adenylate/guanylate cyclase domain-containing protein [Sterolibacterium sp.]|nr:adenylate/guanylate cyclase domain-containing protein [Sterolibacterium sp.]
MPGSALLPLFSSPIAAIRWLIALLAVAVTVCLEGGAEPGQTAFADAWLRDHFTRWQASAVEDQRLLVVDIDEASLTALGPWPWPRQRIADLVENLLADGASGVALDLILPEKADSAGDMRLAMLAQHGPVVLGQAFDYESRPLPLRVGQLAEGGSKAAEQHAAAIPAKGYIANHSGLAQARYVGNIGFVPDQDGMLRRLPLNTSFAGRLHPTLALALLECCAAAGSSNPILPAGMVQRPADGGFLPLKFSHDWSAYTVVSAAGILQRRSDTKLAAVVSGRLVLVGSSALGLADRVSTPLTSSTAGVMVHASALSSLLDARDQKESVAWPGRWIAILFAILVAGLANVGFPRLSALTNAAMLAVASAIWVVLAYGLSRYDNGFSTTGPLATIAFLLAVAIPFDWQVSQQRSRRLLGTLHQYVARAVVDTLLRSNAKNPLALKRVDVTTLIADLQGYTSHVESLPMEAAAQLTREFLDCLTRPVLKYQGTLDKYTGDGLVAFWGAPLADSGHADLALDAAKEILREVHAYNAVRRRAGLTPLRVRIGIDSGPAMAGDFGTSQRSVYTAVGDSVNTASRLEQEARNRPYDVIIGQGTASLCTRHELILLGEVLLRGKEKPTTLYTFAPAPAELSGISAQ